VECALVEVSDLVDMGADYNPREDLRPGDPDFEMISNSLAEFGQVRMLVVNKRTGNIVGGHQRVKSLQEGEEKYARVVFVDLPEDKERVLNVALNRIGEGRKNWSPTALEAALGAIHDPQLRGATGLESFVAKPSNLVPGSDLGRMGWRGMYANLGVDIAEDILSSIMVISDQIGVDEEAVVDMATEGVIGG